MVEAHLWSLVEATHIYLKNAMAAAVAAAAPTSSCKTAAGLAGKMDAKSRCEFELV